MITSPALPDTPGEVETNATLRAWNYGANRIALLVIDAQQGFASPVWGNRNNPGADANIARLVTAFADVGYPIVYVRHDSADPASPLRPGQPGNDLKGYLTAEPSVLITKQVNSAFHGAPDLDEWLMSQHVDEVVVTGITTNHCCETTARVAGNLGYTVHFVLDATYTFDRVGPDGRVWDADLLAQVTSANLHGEFANVLNTDDILGPPGTPGQHSTFERSL